MSVQDTGALAALIASDGARSTIRAGRCWSRFPPNPHRRRPHQRASPPSPDDARPAAGNPRHSVSIRRNRDGRASPEWNLLAVDAMKVVGPAPRRGGELDVELPVLAPLASIEPVMEDGEHVVVLR